MDELNWDHDEDHEDDLDEFSEPADMDAFYKTLKIALRIQAQMAAEMESAGQLGIGQ